ncbi:hypothetical protein HED60_02635 [Planctomycetales bacterium ZRK34]|nr:hypothetical protein HED60_02635 [Planctomycetales bacterium ZRK34]
MKYPLVATVVGLMVFHFCLAAFAEPVAAPGWTLTNFAGAGSRQAGPTSGLATQVNIGQPFGAEAGPDGAIYITEVEHHRIWRVDPKTGQAKVVVGTGRKGYSGDGGPALEADLNEPYEVRFDHDGNMYFVERLNHIVRRVDHQTGHVTTIAGTGAQGYSGDGGPATKAQLRQPHSIALDHRGGLYIADIGNHRIRRVDLATGIITTIAGNGERKPPIDGELAAGHAMLGPRALYIRDNIMWIALREGHAVWKLDLSTGRLAHIAGTGRKGYTGDGGPASDGTFNGPKGIVVDPDRNIYVVDTENHAIRRIEARTGKLTTIASGMNRPHGIGLDEQGHLYVGDTNHHRVPCIAPAAQ